MIHQATRTETPRLGTDFGKYHTDRVDTCCRMNPSTWFSARRSSTISRSSQPGTRSGGSFERLAQSFSKSPSDSPDSRLAPVS